jgi:glycosyltransferase involved in cell wall biosynthesis
VIALGGVRILLDYRPALKERTGVGEFVHELARALARTGSDEVAVLSTSLTDRPSGDAVRALKGVRVIDRRLPVQGLTWAWNRVGWPPVEWLAGAADVVHAQTPLLIPSRRAARVVTIHDLDFLLHPERVEAEIRRDFAPLVSAHVRRADHVVVSSQYAARRVSERLGVAPDGLTVCSPGAPAWAQHVARTRAERAGTAGTAAIQGTILFLGTLEPRKNIGTLLDAYARLRHRRPDAPSLVLAGRQRASVAPELRRLEAPPFAGFVSAKGYVSDAARQALYRDAQMLVLPSLDEGFGLPVLEAMACGVPVVVSDRGSLPEVVGDAAFPVKATDPEALAAEMERLLDPDAAREATTRGSARASRYSWNGCAAAVRGAYRAAVEAKAARDAGVGGGSGRPS